MLITEAAEDLQKEDTNMGSSPISATHKLLRSLASVNRSERFSLTVKWGLSTKHPNVLVRIQGSPVCGAPSAGEAAGPEMLEIVVAAILAPFAPPLLQD